MNPLAEKTFTALKKSMNDEQLRRFGQLLEDKYLFALETWAMVKMGTEKTKFQELSLELFLINLERCGVLDAIKSGDPFPLIEIIPYLIPPSLNDRVDLPLGQYDPSKIQSEYEQIVKIVTEARRKTKKKRLPPHPGASRGPQALTPWRLQTTMVATQNETAWYMALEHCLPGYPGERIKEAILKEQKPHLIALDYIAHRYNLRYQGESLRKRLAIMKNPDRLNKSIEKDLFKSLELALSIGK